jgi:hypothetical protein
MDVFSPVMSLIHTLKELSLILDRMALIFPLRFMTAEVVNRATSRQYQKGDNDNNKVGASTFAPFQYNNSEDNKDDILSQSYTQCVTWVEPRVSPGDSTSMVRGNTTPKPKADSINALVPMINRQK